MSAQVSKTSQAVPAHRRHLHRGVGLPRRDRLQEHLDVGVLGPERCSRASRRVAQDARSLRFIHLISAGPRPRPSGAPEPACPPAGPQAASATPPRPPESQGHQPAPSQPGYAIAIVASLYVCPLCAPPAPPPPRRASHTIASDLRLARRHATTTPGAVMPTYPASETERRVDAVALGQLVGAVFRHCGMRPNDAPSWRTPWSRPTAGVHSHGVLRVPEYVRKLAGGGRRPPGAPGGGAPGGACLVVDGGNSMGQIGAHFAMRRAIEVAGGSLGAPGVLPGRGSPPPPCGGATTAGRWPTTPCRLPADMIGLATTNAPPTMAPLGARSACWGSTPGRGRPRRRRAAHRLRRLQRHRPRQGAGLPPEGTDLPRAGPSTGTGAPPRPRALDGLRSPSGASKAPPWPC